MPRFVFEKDTIGRPTIYVESDDGTRIPVLEMGPSGEAWNVAGGPDSSVLIPNWVEIDTPGSSNP